ncbi:MAG: enoyl-CoA hydratase [Ilumatobacteraceae bacterium]
MSDHIRYETPADRIARIVLNRPDKRNAQNGELLYALDDAFSRAAADDSVAVVILAAEGPDFSSGHDLSSPIAVDAEGPRGCCGGFGLPGIEGWWATEREIFVGLCERWRNIPKPTIAQVQGRVIAGGLMLVWPCDLVVASDDATFSDPVVAFGVNGVEYFRHPFEVGSRRAKEWLFTGDDITAAEAHAIGMVNRVVPSAELAAATLELAQRIAQRPSMGLRLAKQAVNQAEDRMGITDSMWTAHSLHVLGHAHNLHTHGILVDPSGAAVIRNSKKK